MFITELYWISVMCDGVSYGDGGLLGFGHTVYWASAILLLGFGHTDYWASAILLLGFGHTDTGLRPYCYWGFHAYTVYWGYAHTVYWGVIRVGWIDYWGFAHTVYCTVWRPRHTILSVILFVTAILTAIELLVFLCLPWTYWAPIYNAHTHIDCFAGFGIPLRQGSHSFFSSRASSLEI